MNLKIKAILERLEQLEDELRAELKNQEEQLQYRLEGTRVLFDQTVRDAHSRLREGLLPWFRSASWRNILSSPFIYGMLVPLALLDLSLSIYQAICFRLYRIPRVRRSRYIVIDRHYLSYLNGIEKLNCIYCGYGNGVIAYGREIISRTEQYWCPIKHARDIPGAHKRYTGFLAYGDATDFRAQLQQYREQLRQEQGD